MTHRIIGVIVTVVHCVMRPALAQDGRLVEASAVTLLEETLTRLEPLEPTIRTILAQVDLKSMTYLSNGLRVKGYLAVPKRGGRLPCVIVNRGGNRPFGALTDGSAARVLGKLATWGYVVAASQYRGNAGEEGRKEFGGADLHDVPHRIQLLESLPQADPSRIGMFCWSRGGLTTYLALTKTDRIRTAVIGGGMSDAFDTVARQPEMDIWQFAEVIPDYTQHKEAALHACSPVRWPERLHKHTPLLLLHGSADWGVHPTQSLAMASALYASRHPFRFVFFEGGDHGLSEYERRSTDGSPRGWIATCATARPGPASNRTGGDPTAIVPADRVGLTPLGAMAPAAVRCPGKRSHPWRGCAAIGGGGAGRHPLVSRP
jgi:dipeptidyl aminopeptidase/acylaminoacyl peptidase